MNYAEIDISLQEVPGEISLSFTITGCPHHCHGCHSPYLWPANKGQQLTPAVFENNIDKYSPMISCVLFMGGEWHEKELQDYLSTAKKMSLKTCLYTGKEWISDELIKSLTFVKYGPWVAELGGLGEQHTNQRFIETKSGKCLNYLFIR